MESKKGTILVATLKKNMETITINEIEKKPSGLVIVKYHSGYTQPNGAEATMNVKWQSQEVDYIEKDVGLGGSVSVLIQQKGDYTNITKIDMTSAKKGVAQDNDEKPNVQGTEPSRDDKWRNPAEMQAIELVKCATELAQNNLPAETTMDNEKLGEFLCMAVTELHGAYKVALDRLK